jgi:hypothetical protein
LPGLPNPLLVGKLFRQYSQPWKGIAEAHISNVSIACQTFLEKVLEHIANENVKDRIWQFWIAPILQEKFAAAENRLNDLLEVHQEPAMTTNHHFTKSRRQLHRKIRETTMEQRLKQEFSQPVQNLNINDVARIMSSVKLENSADTDMDAARDLFDNMAAYYEIALNLFGDNVPSLVVHASIVRRLPQIFCPTAVIDMPADLVAKIAGESAEEEAKRDEVLRQLKILEAGAKICKKHGIRAESGM